LCRRFAAINEDIEGIAVKNGTAGLSSTLSIATLRDRVENPENSMSSSQGQSEKSPLEAAQKIVTELTGMSAEHQALALKFALETLGLQPPTSSGIVAPTTAVTLQHVPQTSGGIEHSTDIRTFTAQKAPTSDQQFAAVVAYFYQFEAKLEDRKDSIDSDVMKEAARLAGRPQVQRWNMTLTNAKNAGYLDNAGNGKYKLSSVGENLVAITLPGGSGGGQTRATALSKRPKKKIPLKPAKKK
jgi:hypothetical protein